LSLWLKTEASLRCAYAFGTGTDGTLGLRAIKEQAAWHAQTLESAKHDAMLRSAIATGLVDMSAG